MAHRPWSFSPHVILESFQHQCSDQEGVALLQWAFWSADTLKYLSDIDIEYSATRHTPGDHPSNIVDIAHARWAATTAMTALDLAAAALARIFCNHREEKEFDLADFEYSLNKRSSRNYDKANLLPNEFKIWVNAVLCDPAYKDIKEIRDKLVHRRLPRQVYGSIGAAEPRLGLRTIRNTVSVDSLVELSERLAIMHLHELLSLLASSIKQK